MTPKREDGLTDSQSSELDAVAEMSEDDIDTSDIPEIREFYNPRRGLFAGSPNRRAVPKRAMAQREPPARVFPDRSRRSC